LSNQGRVEVEKGVKVGKSQDALVISQQKTRKIKNIYITRITISPTRRIFPPAQSPTGKKKKRSCEKKIKRTGTLIEIFLERAPIGTCPLGNFWGNKIPTYSRKTFMAIRGVYPGWTVGKSSRHEEKSTSHKPYSGRMDIIALIWTTKRRVEELSKFSNQPPKRGVSGEVGTGQHYPQNHNPRVWVDPRTRGREGEKPFLLS